MVQTIVGRPSPVPHVHLLSVVAWRSVETFLIPELPVVFTSAVSSLRAASCPFSLQPTSPWDMAGIPAPPLSSSGSSSPPPASPRRGQPAQPKIATANKEMSSLGLLSSAGAHFFQPGFKLRNTSVCLVSARCQHFCSACSGATGRLMNSVGKTSRNNSISFFSPFTWN